MALLLRRNNNSPTDPWTMLEQMVSEPFFRHTELPVGAEPGVLAIDTTEDAEGITVKANLPGFTKDQITIDVHEDVLTIHAQKTEEKEEKNTTVHRRERYEGSLMRRVRLPSPVSDEGASAALRDGVLTLRLPRSRERSPRKIAVM